MSKPYVRFLPGRLRTLRTGRRERGVVLVVALILVVVIGVSSAAAIRSSLFGDLVTQNMRSQNLAFQAAEAGLRFCEQRVFANDLAGMNVITGTGGPVNEWTDADVWSTRANAPTAAFLGGSVGFATPPQCLIRMLDYDTVASALTGSSKSVDYLENSGFTREQYAFYRITARGFSPDYSETAGVPVSGSQVTVQSMVRGLLESVP